MVDSIDDVLRSDSTTSKEAAIETTDSVLTALNAIELDVDLAVIIVESEADVHNLAVLFVALSLDVFFEFLLPSRLSLPVMLLVQIQ